MRRLSTRIHTMRVSFAVPVLFHSWAKNINVAALILRNRGGSAKKAFGPTFSFLLGQFRDVECLKNNRLPFVKEPAAFEERAVLRRCACSIVDCNCFHGRVPTV